MNSELHSIWSLIATYKIEAALTALLIIVIFSIIISRIREKNGDFDYSGADHSGQDFLSVSDRKTPDLNHEISFERESSVPNTESDAETGEIKAFTSDDIKVLGIHQNMTTQEVDDLFGEPVDDQNNYQFGSIVFSSMEGFDKTDIEINLDNPDFAAPREIKIGDQVDLVLLKFPRVEEDENFESEGESILYDLVNENEIFTGKIYYDTYTEIESIQINHISDALWYLELYIANNIVTSIKYGCSSVDIEAAIEVLY